MSQHTLPRVLGPWMAAAIVVGTVIGSGVFKKAQNVAERVPELGPAMLVWVLGGTLALLGALSLAEIAVRFPRAGGNYAFLAAGYGRMTGFLWGWVEFWIIRSASIAALSTMFAEGLNDVVKQSLGLSEDWLTFWPRQLAAIGVVFTLATVNALGTRLGGRLQVALTAVKIGSIVGIILLPFVILATVDAPSHPPSVRNFGRLWPEDWSAFNIAKFGSALVAVLWAYHGWMNIGPVAEEVRRPSRNIPLALLGGVVLLIVIYVGANLAYYSVIPRPELAAVKTAVSTEFGLRLLGSTGAILASAALMLSVFGSLNGNLLVGPRLVYAMARDGLAPAAVGGVNARTQTPVGATAVLAAWSCLLILIVGALTQNRLPPLALAGLTVDVNLPADKPPFDVVTDFAMFGAVSFETLVISTLFVFRRRDVAGAEPPAYRCPGYPLVPGLYIALMLCVLTNMFASPDQRAESLVGLAFIAVGAGVYGLVGRAKGGPAPGEPAAWSAAPGEPAA